MHVYLYIYIYINDLLNSCKILGSWIGVCAFFLESSCHFSEKNLKGRCKPKWLGLNWTCSSYNFKALDILKLGLPGSSAGKESACNAGDPSAIPESGSYPGEGTGYLLQYSWASLVAQMVKSCPAVWETWVRSLGWEDPLEEGTETHSSILVWRMPMDREGWQATINGVTKSWTRLSD